MRKIFLKKGSYLSVLNGTEYNYGAEINALRVESNFVMYS